jgi:hypothetical protein
MRVARRNLAALLLSASMAVSARVSAQSSPTDEGTPGWIFTPSVSFGGMWDDNLLLAHEGDNPPSDYGTPINPSGALDYTGRRVRFSSTYGGTFVVYRSLTELNSSQQQFTALMEARPARRLTMFVREGFAMAPTTDTLELAGVPFYRIGSRHNVVSGGIEAAVMRRAALSAVYSLSTVSFAEDEREAIGLQGGLAHEFLVSLSHAVSERLTLGGEYQVRRAVLSEGEDRFNIQTGSATFAYQVTPTVSISGLGGIARLGAGLTHDARMGPAVEAAITYEPRRATLSAAYQHTFIPSWGFGGTFQNQEWMGTVIVPFARNRAYLNGTITRYDAESLEIGQPSLQSWFLSSTVGYRATRWLSVEGYYGRAQQDSQVAGGARRRNEIGFRVVATKPLKLQ